MLRDGRVGWVLGDTIEPIGAGPDAPEGATKPGFFAPPALQEAHGGFALMGGVFDRDGYVELRPAWVVGASDASGTLCRLGAPIQGSTLRLRIGRDLEFGSGLGRGALLYMSAVEAFVSSPTMILCVMVQAFSMLELGGAY